MDAKERDVIVHAHFQNCIQAISVQVGQPVRAAMCVLRWEKEVTGAAVLPNLSTPQTKMNLIDSLLKQIHSIGSNVKAAINTSRHEKRD